MEMAVEAYKYRPSNYIQKCIQTFAAISLSSDGVATKAWKSSNQIS